MRRLLVFSVVIFLSAALTACERNQGVQAASESDTYHPRPAPSPPPVTQKEPTQKQMKGELIRVDPQDKSIVVRLENGMVQTFRFDDSTNIEGLPNEAQPKTTTKKQTNTITVRNLVGKEGSEVTIDWDEADTPKLATSVEVTQLSTAKSVRRSKR